jgi:hypothetical protein
LIAHQIGHELAGDAIGHMGHLRPRDVLEIGRRQMLRAAVADAAIVQRARGFFGRGHEIADGLVGLTGVDHDHVRQCRQQ